MLFLVECVNKWLTAQFHMSMLCSEMNEFYSSHYANYLMIKKCS